MTQLLIDHATLEQLVRMLEQCLDDAIQVQCDLEQGYSKSLALAQMVQVELSKEALTAGRDAIANAELDTTQRDAELWRAYKARKDAAINAGMGKSVVRTGPM